MIRIAESKTYYINERALSFVENDKGNPNRVSVALSSGAAILVYAPAEGIDFGVDGSYQKWKLEGYDTLLVANNHKYIYARLSRSESTALIVFDEKLRSVQGGELTVKEDESGNTVTVEGPANEDYYFVKIGELTATDGTSERVITYDSGLLSTPQRMMEAENKLDEMFELDKQMDPYLILAKYGFKKTSFQQIVIGDAMLEYDAVNKAVRVRQRDAEDGEKELAPIQVGFYAEGFVSAKGASSGGQGGGGSASALYQLNDVLKNATEDGVQGAEKDKVLMFNGTHWYAGDAKGKVVAVKVGQEEYKPSEEGIVTLPEFAKVVDKTLTVDKFIGALEGNADTATKLKNALTIQKNKTEIGVFDGSEAKTVNIEVPTKVSELENDSKFLTEHQKLYALTIQGNGKQLGVYTPNEAAKSINITPLGIGAAASSHTHVISDVTNLQAALDSKLNASIFTDLFEKVLLSDGVTYAIRAKYGFYSDSFVSAKGANSGTGGSTGGAASIYVGSTLYTPDGEGIIHLPAYPTVPTALKNPYALTIQKNGITQGVYDGSVAKEINLSVPTKVSELTNDSNFLTAHQTLYALTIQGNGTTIGTYTPNSEDKSINITAAGIGAAATTHKQAYTADECTTYSADDNTMGVTPAAVKKAVGLFEPKSHTHTVLGTVTAGSSSNPVYFNAGVPTAVDKTATFNAFVNSIAVGFDAPTDADYYISQYVGGGTENTTYRRRSHSALYTYIKNKAEGTWGINISGNAATATKLQTSRKIWGQAFDGSADVSGAMTGVTSITIGDCVITYDSANKGLKFSTGIYSEQYVSAKGANSSTGGSTGGAASIKIGSDLYTPDGEGIIHLPAYPTIPVSLKNPYALTIQKNGVTQGVYDGSTEKSVNITVPTKVSELTNDSNFLTAHQTLYELTIQGNGTSLGVYTPNSEAKSINITAAGIGAAAATHKQAYTADACTTYTTDNENMGVTPAAVKKAIGLFEPKAHTHNVLGTVTAGSSSNPVYFNAGVPTAVDKTATFNALVNSITVGSATPKDEDYYISQYSGGGTTTTTYHRRPHSALYAYLKGKAEGTWGINISGNAATATKLQTARKIWGQAFDGSADVSGALTGVTSITIGDCVITYDSANKGLKFSMGIYSEQYVSAKGANSSTGGSTGGAASIYLGSDLYTPDGEGIIHLPAYPTVPTSLKNPYALTIQANGTSLGTYDGSAAKTFNLNYSNIGAAAATHTHDYLPLSGGTLGSTSASTTWLNLNSSTAKLMMCAYSDGVNYIESVNGGNTANAPLTISGKGAGIGSTLNLNFTNITTRGSYTNIDSGNYNSYAPTLTGTGASGTWNINVSGYAGALYKANYITNLNSPVWGVSDNYSINYNTCDSTVSNAPSRIDNANLIMNIQNGKHGTSGQYGWQVGFFHNLNAPYVRKWTGGSVGSWIKLLTSGNYNEFAPSKDGTGASGTWSIGITGNAATATKLKNYYSSRPSNANITQDGSGGMVKFLATSTMTSNKPTVEGHILHFFWDNTGGWDAQLMIPNNGNASYEPQWRGQNNGTWGSWISLVTSGTIGNYNAGSATKLQTARTIWGQSFNGTANISGTITGSYFKINDSSTSPYLWLNGWYVQVNNSMLQMGNAAEYSIKVDSSGNLILPTSSRRIYFNGSTSDNQCIVYDNSSGRLSVGSSAAKGFNVGDLLVSSEWADYAKVPTNGIYSKGDIYSAGAITAKASSSDIRLKRDLTEYDALSIVRGQRSVKYHWNMTAKKNSAIFDDDDWHYGLIAQELQREHPQLVKDVFGDYLTIDYERLIPILWRAVQQLAKRNEELEMKLNEERRD